jgi:CubicO group peptidase (beta-lactamase class C family)
MRTHSIFFAFVVLVGLRADAEPAALPSVVSAVNGFIESKEVAGAVTAVVNREGIIHLAAQGKADLASGDPMRGDAIFWIASMTKPVTGVAIMMLADEGKLSVDDPIGKHIPELSDLKLADGTKAKITIRHILTHTSGMSDISGEEEAACKTLAELIPIYAKKPVTFTPGSKWSYNQAGMNTAGRIVEVLSGQSFDEFLEKRLFGPLGMKDTTFYLSEGQLPRLARSYKRTPEGKLEEAAIFILHGKSPSSRDRFPGAHGGLFSTAGDYARFCRMVLNKGTLDGKKYLSPEAVSLMTSVQSGEVKTGFTEGNGWGIGWCVVRQPQGVSAMLSPGSAGHGGAYGTQAWADQKNGLAYVLMVQRSNFPNADASDLRKAFQEAASATVRGK